MMRAVVVTGGQAPNSERISEWCGSAELTVAADSGLDTLLNSGQRADLVVGDFDSISDQRVLLELPDVERYSTEKDFTDTELAIRAARDRGADEVVLLGGGGGRFDHLLAIVAMFERDERPEIWESADSVVCSVSTTYSAVGDPGDLVSFFPLGCEPCRMLSSGLKWPLDGLVWTRGDTGVSNEFLEREIRVQMVEGRLLVVRPAKPR